MIDRTYKIVFVGFLPGFGGAEKSMIMLANSLSELGHKVSIISLKDNNVVYKINNKVNYIYIPDTQNIKIKRQMDRFFSLKKKFYEINPDVVISFWLQPAIFSAILSKFCGFKTIYSERGDPTDKEYSSILGILRDIFLRFIDGFVFQTEGAKKCFPKVIQNKGIVINNPVYINYDDYTLPKERRKVIVNVGRLHEQKNQSLLINAFAKISNDFADYTLEIYGDGELKNDLERQIEELNLKNKVILKGTTKKLFDEIYDASLFVLSSNYEGMPNALMEAMALGIPSISTDCKPGGAREIIQNKVNGEIVERNNSTQLANTMEKVLKSGKISNMYSKNCREIIFSHSPEKIFLQWESYIINLILNT